MIMNVQLKILNPDSEGSLQTSTYSLVKKQIALSRVNFTIHWSPLDLLEIGWSITELSG